MYTRIFFKWNYLSLFDTFDLRSDLMNNFRSNKKLILISNLPIPKTVSKGQTNYNKVFTTNNQMTLTFSALKNEVHLSLSRGDPTALVLLNLSAAFDTIDHSTLLSCLGIWFGVSGSVLKWFTSCLTDRYQ